MLPVLCPHLLPMLTVHTMHDTHSLPHTSIYTPAGLMACRGLFSLHLLSLPFPVGPRSGHLHCNRGQTPQGYTSAGPRGEEGDSRPQAHHPHGAV